MPRTASALPVSLSALPGTRPRLASVANRHTAAQILRNSRPAVSTYLTHLLTIRARAGHDAYVSQSVAPAGGAVHGPGWTRWEEGTLAVATLSPARALRRPRRADPRALVGVFLTLAALAGSVGFWVRSSDVRPVLVAARDLPPGATLQAADLTVAYVHMDDALIGAAVSADDVNSLAGRQLKEPVHAQQILVRAQLAARDGLAADQVAMTIPARNDSAVDGGLQPGDFVQILLTVSDKNRGEAHTVVALERAHVLGVGRDQSTSISSSSSLADENRFARGALSSVTLAVTPEQARHLAEARRSGDLDILLLPPTEPAQP